MNYSQIYSAVLNKCNIDTDDDQAIKVVKDGINEGYKDIAKEVKLITKTSLNISNKIATFPEDMLDIIEISPQLDSTDKMIGHNIYTEKTEPFALIYSKLPDDLVKDNDEPELPIKYHELLVDYGCYVYYQFKKKDAAGEFYNSFKNNMALMRTNNLGSETIRSVYSI